LITKLKTKGIKALGGRVTRNNTLRQDMIKRYWVHNSDDEEEVSTAVDDAKTYLTSNGPVPACEAELAFQEEFFPVTICQKRQFLKVKDPISVFTYDVVESRP